MAALTHVGRWFHRKPTQLRETSAMRHRVLRGMMLLATHAPPSRWGNTPLRFAIDCNHPDVAAFLRSIGAPE
jgi:hypothetical protein